MELLEVGALVRLADQPDWGVGQVQSIVTDQFGARVTVNFEDAGKKVINPENVEVELVEFDQR